VVEEKVAMRGLTSTIVLLLVLAGLVGYVYFVDRERTPGDENAKPKAFELSPENIEEVTIKNAEGQTARVQRVDASWRVIEPEKADADAAEVAAITSSLASLEVQRVVDENPGDLAQYGLAPPRIDVAFRLKDQKEFQRLLVGEKTPTGGDVYAKTPSSNRVFLISSYLESTFNKNAFNLRDKAILKFDRDKADVVEIVNGGNALEFTRQGTDWRIAKPIAARADYAAVEALVQRLSSGQMQEIVEADATDLRKYGLDNPPLRANVGTGSARATLLVGTPDPDGMPYAKDVSRPAVFTIDQSLTTDLSKPPDDYRRKDVFDFRSFNANRVELTRDGASRAFAKTKGADGKEVWRDAAGKDVDTAAVENLLTQLTNLRAQSFEAAAHPSLKSPVLTVVARFDENKTETVTFARAGADVYASRADEPGSARLEANTFDEAVKALDGLK
jgi:hypothetical protein